MKKSLLLRLAVLFLATTMLSGCIWWPDDGGYYRGGHYDRDRGGGYHRDHHEDRHDDRG